MEIRVLGPLQVFDGGRLIEIRRPMERALFSLLAAEPGRLVPSDRLIDGLWAESPPTTAAKTLQTYIHHLRSLLPEGAIVTERHGYRLVAAESDVDAYRFGSAVAEARSLLPDSPEQALDMLARALAWWQAAPFPDAEDAESLQPLRTRLEAQRLQALANWCEAQVLTGRHDEAVPALRSLIEEHPLREDLWGLYMLALYRSGRQAEALRAYADARRRLGEELGIEPGPDLRRLEERILAQDPELAPIPQPPSSPQPEIQEPRPASRRTTTAGQRHVTVVLSELTGADAVEEAVGVDDAVRALEEIYRAGAKVLEGWGGTMVSGDGPRLLAVFGVPMAREDDTYRGIRAALALSSEVAARSREVAHSWGVADIAASAAVRITPLTVAGDSYQGLDESVAILDDVLSRTDPGSVVVDDHTRHLMGDLFQWEEIPIGEGDARLWTVEAVRQRADKARMDRRLRAPFVGREEEMAVAAAALDSLRRGIGGVLLVSGEAGVGKTRLVAELRGSPAYQDTTWLLGHCVPYGEASPYWPLRDLFRGWLGLGVDDTDLKARVALHGRLDEVFAGRADDLYPYIGGVLGVALERDQAARLDLASEALQYRTFEVIRTFVEGLAEQTPVVLVIEDMHWADPTSIQLLDHLLPVTESAALLLVLTSRPDPDHPSLRFGDEARRRIPHLTRDVKLQQLADDAQRAMLRALIGSDTVPAATVRRILQLAEGNPFYLEELIGSLIDDGALVPSESGWRFDHDVAVTVPETVEKVVQARIDRLAPDVHQVLTAASVLGRNFGLPLLQGVVGEGGRVVDSVQDLLRLGLFVEARRWPQAEYLFKHALIQEAAYRTLTKERRLTLHRAAAEWLEQRYRDQPDEGVGMLARHWAAAGDEDKAIDAFMRAGDLARRDHALDEAIEHYQEALPILDRRGHRQTMALVLFKLGLALHTSLRFAESNASYQRAFDLWDPPVPSPPTAVLSFGGPPFSSHPDPVRSYNLQDIQLQMALFDRLVDRRADDTLVPGLADRWEISDDGLSYRFHLREGLKWSDGHTLTAHDAEYGIMRNLEPGRPGVSVAMLYVLEGAQDFAAGRQLDPSTVGVRAIDEHTVTFRLVAPAPYFIGMLNRPDCGPQPRHGIEMHGDAWARAENEIVSGPHRRSASGHLTLHRRDDYQGARSGNVGTVRWRRGGYEELIAAFQAGELDLLWIRGHYLGTGFEHLPRELVRFEPAAFLFYLVFDTRKTLPADARFRLALAHGIDRSMWAETLPEYMTPARGGVVPPALSGHTPDIVPTFDPGLSSQLLSELEVGTIRIGLPDLPEHVFTFLVDSVATMWQRLGLDVEIVRLDPRRGQIPAEEDEVDVFPAMWFPGYTDPEYYLRLLLHSQAADNFGRFSDPDFDDLVEQATRERDERLRLSLFHQADRLAVAEKAAVIPMVYARNISVSRPGVDGWWEFGKSWANFADLVVG